MKKILLSFLLVFSSLALFANEEKMQADAVKNLVEKAVVMAISEGKTRVLTEINDKNGAFIDGELYLFAGSTKKVTILAHPYHSELIGADNSLMNDNHGNYINFEFTKIALENGAGWSKYWWYKPNSRRRFHKKTFVMKVPMQDYFIGGGYYSKP